MGLFAFSGLCLIAGSSSADVCSTTRDFIAGRVKFSRDDLVVASDSVLTKRDGLSLGTFNITYRVAGARVFAPAVLNIVDLFVDRVFYGDDMLVGRHVRYLSIQDCAEFNCEIAEKTLSEVKKEALSQLALAGPDSRPNDVRVPTEEKFRAPYTLYIFRPFNPEGDIGLGNAEPLWTYFHRADGLTFFQEGCGWYPIANAEEDRLVRTMIESIKETFH
jgi:hypothetical protein